MNIQNESIKKRILVVDDETNSRELLSMILMDMGFEVVTSSNGYEALGEMHKSTFHLIISDINMHGMSGWELTQCIRQLNLKTPIILITGDDTTKTENNAIGMNINGVMYKPFRINDLRNMVAKLSVPEKMAIHIC